MKTPIPSIERTMETAETAPRLSQVFPVDERRRQRLAGLAAQIEAQVEAEARSRLWAIKPARRLGQLARALAEAHQRGDVPDLLSRVQYRPQVEALLALETWLAEDPHADQDTERPPLAESHVKRLASARLQRA